MIRSMPKFDTHSARPGRAATQQEHDASARSARALQALPVGSVQNSRGAAWQLPKWADRKPCACARKNCVDQLLFLETAKFEEICTCGGAGGRPEGRLQRVPS